MDDPTKKRIRIAEQAAKKYLKNDRFTIQSLAEELDMKSSEVFELFPNRSSMLSYFYESRIILYEEQTKHIKDYDGFTLSEKLSNFALSLLDQFNEHREFVLLTYKPVISKNYRATKFDENFKKTIRTIFEDDKHRSSSSSIVLNNAFYTLLLYHFHALIEFWRNDDSIQYQNSMALVDKWASFTEEVFYSAIVDKGLDLTKFMFYQSPFRNFMFNLRNPGSENE